jgi:hypothetical protein
VDTPKVLGTPPYRIHSIIEVVGIVIHYILPRMPSYPIHFLLLNSFLLSKTAMQTYLYC